MRKNIILGGLFILVLLSAVGFVIANSHFELSEEALNVPTSNGTLDLPNGTLVGGEPTNYITLTEATTMETTTGPETFTAGTKIDCDHSPGEPDPCDS